MPKLRCAVVGVGYLGKFHAQKYTQMSEAELVAVCDVDKERCQEIAAKYHVEAIFDYEKLLGKIDAVNIVVPTILHYGVAKFFLENGIHVLLEKPITTTVAEADELIDIAKQKGVVLQVGHLERFNNVLHAVDKILDQPRFIESHRLATFKPRGIDVNVMLDLMIHDIDIIQYLVKSPIKNIYANGASVLTNSTDIANARIQFENHCVANVTSSRISFRNERRMRIFQHDAYITFDLQHKHLSVHRKGEGEMFPGVPEIITYEENFEKGDEIQEEISSFVKSITCHTPPVVSGEDGKNALATAIKITQLIHSQFEAAETSA